MTAILITGAQGQVGRELAAYLWPSSYRVTALARDALDISQREAVLAAVTRFAPDVIVNAAAFTAVDRAESEARQAFAINRDGSAYLAHAAARRGAWLLHLSTDYVFDGLAASAYAENTPTRPLGVYGVSKQAGEAAIRDALGTHIILRTAWVFGRHGSNFVKTMLRLAGQRPQLEVVADQIGCPTPAAAIAAAVAQIIAHRHEPAAAGTYHFAGDRPISWYGFAQALFESAARHGVHPPRLAPIASSAYPALAQRPANSVLDCRKIGRVFGIHTANWRNALDELVPGLLK